jgi:hypothetical protein
VAQVPNLLRLILNRLAKLSERLVDFFIPCDLNLSRGAVKYRFGRVKAEAVLHYAIEIAPKTRQSIFHRRSGTALLERPKVHWAVYLPAILPGDFGPLLQHG